MRIMMNVCIPVEEVNKAMQDGSAGRTLQSVFETWRPEAVYFFPTDQGRNLLLFVDVKENSDMPVIAEPFFRMNAKITVTPVMNAQDFQAAMGKLAH